MKAIQIFDMDLTLLGEIAHYQSLRLCRKFREVGDFELVLPLSHPMAGKLQRDCILCPAGEMHKAMLIETVTRDVGRNTLSATGFTLSGLLRRRICIPPETGEASYGYDRIVSDAESVMRHYVDGNVVNPLSAARKMDCVVLERENGMRGMQNVPWSARFEQLDELLFSIGAYCDAGYAIVPDLVEKKLVFTFLPGRDRTGADGAARVTFGVHMGNVSSTVETENALQAKNAAVVGGAGEETERLILSVCPGGETGVSRREMFADAGSVREVQELAYEGVRRLAPKGIMRSIGAQVIQTPSCRCGVHWDLGDLVTVIAPGTRMNARITQVQESHEAGRAAKIDVVFGDPAGGIERVIRERTGTSVR